jgi:putative hydrolase of the HAD superfamily
MARITAVLFDADGVIQQPPANWRDALGALCGRPDQSDAFLASVFEAERPCVDGSVDFRAALAEVLMRWRSAVSVDDALSLLAQIDPDPEILSIVAAVRRPEVVVALATNQQRYRASFMTESLGYTQRFDHLLYSCDLGCAKPSGKYFRAALRRIGVAPANALFLDDHDRNVAAARSCGLSAERFHLSEGPTRLRNLLRGHGVLVSGDDRS